MEADEELVREERLAILRKVGRGGEALGLGTLSRAALNVFPSTPVLPCVEGPTQDPSTGLPLFTLGVMALDGPDGPVNGTT